MTMRSTSNRWISKVVIGVVAAGMLAVAAGSAGCSAMAEANRRAEADVVTPVSPQQAFDAAAAREAMGPGSASITGVAVARSTSNPLALKWFRDKHFATNSKVWIFPATDYFVEWNKLRDRYTGNARYRVEMSAEALALGESRAIQTDNYGRFRIDNLRPGRYILLCFTSWSEYRRTKYATGTVEASDGSSATIYEHSGYNKGYADTLEEIVEITTPGQTLEVELSN
ncbi:MAG: hypothetical protein MUE97_07675 [Phycisphaerales bacterium]|jgi:hypothetical protein|nr:hypothetical protein [Phycisphaerales bacterium]